MEPTDLTVKVLTEIRDSVHETNSRLDQTNVRLEDTRVGLAHHLEMTRVVLGQRIDALADRMTESEVRTATAIVNLTGTLEDVKALMKDVRVPPPGYVPNAVRGRLARSAADRALFRACGRDARAPRGTQAARVTSRVVVAWGLNAY